MSDFNNNSNVQLPTLDFGAVSRAEMYKKQVLQPTTEGTVVQAKVDKVVVSETGANSKNPGSFQFIFDLRPLNSSGKPCPTTVRYYVPIPRSNPSKPGHMLSRDEVTEAYRKCRDIIRALMGSDTLPPGPRKVEGSSDWTDAAGNVLTKEQMDDMRKASDSAVDAIIGGWYNVNEQTGKRGYEDLKGTLVYCTLKTGNTGYTNVGYVRHDPGDKQVVGAEVVVID